MLFANELVGLLEVFSFMIGISQHFAGITFLAWGNSVGDLCADRSIALSGVHKVLLLHVMLHQYLIYYGHLHLLYH